MSEVYSRRMALHSAPTTWAASQGQQTAGGGSLGRSAHPNVVMILAVLLCALVCALGLNSVARCALRWSNRMAAAANSNSSARTAHGGLEKKALRELPRLVYSKGLRLAGSNPGECAICLSEFVTGERVRVLPTCDHGFHLKCIDRWLAARSSCPTCRLCLSAPFQKAWSCAAGQRRPAPLPGSAVLVPLEPEGLNPRYCV